MLELLRKGDRRAFKDLFDQYAPIFKGIAFRYMKSSHSSNDIVQEAFVKIYLNISKYSGEGNFEGWMKRIVVNCCLDSIGRNKRYQFSDEEIITDHSFTDWEVPLAEMGLKEIISIIDKLPLGLRTVFNLSVFDGFSHKEIGEQLGISPSASRSQLTKAKMKLKQELKKLNILSASA